MDFQTASNILGLTKDYSEKNIKSARNKLAKECASQLKTATKKIEKDKIKTKQSEVNGAYDFLMNKGRKLVPFSVNKEDIEENLYNIKLHEYPSHIIEYPEKPEISHENIESHIDTETSKPQEGEIKEYHEKVFNDTYAECLTSCEESLDHTEEILEETKGYKDKLNKKRSEVSLKESEHKRWWSVFDIISLTALIILIIGAVLWGSTNFSIFFRSMEAKEFLTDENNLNKIGITVSILIPLFFAFVVKFIVIQSKENILNKLYLGLFVASFCISILATIFYNAEIFGVSSTEEMCFEGLVDQDEMGINCDNAYYKKYLHLFLLFIFIISQVAVEALGSAVFIHLGWETIKKYTNSITKNQLKALNKSIVEILAHYDKGKERKRYYKSGINTIHSGKEKFLEGVKATIKSVTKNSKIDTQIHEIRDELTEVELEIQDNTDKVSFNKIKLKEKEEHILALRGTIENGKDDTAKMINKEIMLTIAEDRKAVDECKELIEAQEHTLIDAKNQKAKLLKKIENFERRLKRKT